MRTTLRSVRRRAGPSVGVALVLAVAASALVVAGPVVAGTTSCSYNGTTGYVKVESTALDVSISRDPTGRIVVDGSWCANTATVRNTDRILVYGSAGDQYVSLHLGNGGFRPGRTNEPGTSDEIEFTVRLRGDTDFLFINGGTADDNIRVGWSGATGRVNLNAGESSHVDSDLKVLNDVESLWVYGNGGADRLSGVGGAGTGSEYPLTLRAFGGNGADMVVGGLTTDYLEGNAGGDTLKGRGGADNLDTMDGVSGNDTANGGGGMDTCTTDGGDTQISY